MSHNELPIAIIVPDRSDSEAIVDMHKDTLIHTYPDILPADMERRYDAFGTREERIESMRRRIGSINVNHTVLVAITIEGGDIVGYTNPLRTVTDNDRVGGLYVARDFLGRGIGSRLLGANLDWHGNDQDIFLQTHPARFGFYERFGFSSTGKRADDTMAQQRGVAELNDIIMVSNKKHPSVFCWQP